VANEEHQFDFWLGDWDVYDADGKLVGRNTIKRAVGDTGLREDWRGESGVVGTSLNAFDADRGVWHQTWIDSSGTLLLLEGGLESGTMVLNGKTAEGHQRISWSVLGGNGDRLRQHWETSSDGEHWETLFDGRYSRRR
jgi:hypothetical protein